MTDLAVNDTEVAQVLDDLAAVLLRAVHVDPARLGVQDRIAFLAGIHRAECIIPAIEHPIINTIDRLGDAKSLHVANTNWLLADLLKITVHDAARRRGMARALGPRGDLPPALPETAAAQSRGDIGEPHVRIIRAFLHNLPDAIPADVRAQAEAQLAHTAVNVRPDQLDREAKKLAASINPEGEFSDQDRQRKRAFTLDTPGLDHMAVGKLVADPELQALLDLILAKYGAPGAPRPSDEHTAVDLRTAAQRRHDALKIALQNLVESGQMGSHRGVPATVIVTTTLQELQRAADQAAAGDAVTGLATTGGRKQIPMSDLIRLASRSIHYLAIWHDADKRPLYLGRSQRLASADQRIYALGRDRGCTFTGCNAGGYWVELHHTIEWGDGGHTNADLLTCVCSAHHRLVTKDGWQTVLENGRTVWVPPSGAMQTAA